MSAADPAALLAIHDVGDEAAGARWRDAFEAAGWPGPVLAPDLPGHGETPAPTGGNYELGDAVFFLLPLLAELRENGMPVVVGAGVSGWSAQAIALGGRARAVVVVDGLGGPWLSAREMMAIGRRIQRQIADDPSAMAPPPPSGLDPRLRHAAGRLTNRAMAERIASAMAVPLLAIETGRSVLAAADAADLIAKYASPATLVRVPDGDVKDIARIVLEWSAGRA